MSEIKFTGNKSLSSINRDWCKKFPFLYLRFFNEKGKSLTWDRTHASIRAHKGAKELSSNSNMHVGTFERRYEDAYGVKVEIMYEKNGRRYRSLDDDNEKTLKEYNAAVEAKGGVDIKETHPEWF